MGVDMALNINIRSKSCELYLLEKHMPKEHRNRDRRHGIDAPIRTSACCHRNRRNKIPTGLCETESQPGNAAPACLIYHYLYQNLYLP